MVEGGPHPGDLPNVHVGEEGRLAATFFNDRLTRDHLTDADGAAFIVHAGPDDYES
jgi:Cu-Zn family superoxide dismutase